jgi:hypothetical protein
MLKLRLFLTSLFLLFLPGIALAQGGVEHANFAWALGLGNSVQVLPGASITVCAGTTIPAPGTICSPTTQIYTGPSLTTLAQNPLSPDNAGNFSFWAFPGNSYVISVSKSGYVTYSYSWTAASTLVSPSPNPAQSGVLRLALGDCISWRNSSNNGDNCLTENGSNQLVFAGDPLAGLNVVQSWSATQNFQGITATSVTDSSLTPGNCVQTGAGGLLGNAAGPCLVGTAVTITGSPANGNLTIFSSPNSITNGNLSGDVSTSNSTVTTLATTIGGTHVFSGSITTTNQAINGTPTGSALQGTDPKLMTAGVISGTSVPLCTDISGGATTSGCSSVLAYSVTTESSDTGLSSGSLTTVITKSVTMPSSGCPCRVLANWAQYGTTSGSSAVFEALVSDGSNNFAEAEWPISVNNGVSGTGSGLSPSTYSSSANVTFTLKVQVDASGVTARAAPFHAYGGRNSRLELSILASN